MMWSVPAAQVLAGAARVLFICTVAFGAWLGWVILNDVWTLDADGVSRISRKSPAWDFANLWTGSRLAREGRVETLFDVEAYRAALNAIIGPARAVSEWSYPPSMLIVGLPFTLVPLASGYVAWSVVTLGLLLFVLWRNGAPLLVCALVAVSPAALMNIVFGQNGALTAALLIGGLVAAERRPTLAGLCLGILTVKPQIGLLAPLCLLAARRLSAIAWSAALALGLVVLTALLFGPQVWPLFLQKTAPLMTSYLEADYPHLYQKNGVSVFLLARALGAGLGVAYGVQAVAAVSVGAVAWRLWRSPTPDPLLRAVTTGVLTLLVTPYGYVYEVICLPLAVLLLAARTQWRAPVPMLLLTAIWLWPIFAPGIALALMPLTPVLALAVVGACLSVLLRRPR